MGAVDRIYDEDALAHEPDGIICGFLRQPAIGRPCGQKPLPQEIVDFDVRFRDRTAVALVPALIGAAKIMPRDVTGFAQLPNEKLGVGRVVTLRQSSSPRCAVWGHPCRAETPDHWRACARDTCLSDFPRRAFP